MAPLQFWRPLFLFRDVQPPRREGAQEEAEVGLRPGILNVFEGLEDAVFINCADAHFKSPWGIFYDASFSASAAITGFWFSSRRGLSGAGDQSVLCPPQILRITVVTIPQGVVIGVTSPLVDALMKINHEF